MSFSLVTVRGTISVSDATDTLVTFRLNTAITDGLTLVAPETLVADCATDGTFSIALNANDDNTTLPLNSFYRVEIIHLGVVASAFSITVPAASAGSGANVFALTTIPPSFASVVTPYVSIVDGVGTNLGSAQTLDLASLASEKWLVGTLNANLTVTVANATPGRKGVLILTQDATGGRTLTISDGGGAQAVTIPPGANVGTIVQLYVTDAGNVFAVALSMPGPQGIQGVQGIPGLIGPAGSGITVAGSATLPSSPVDGQVFSLLVDDTNGIEWQMRWSSAKSVWRCIGGSPLQGYQLTTNGGSATTTTTTYAPITGGVTVTLPTVGTSIDLMIEHGAEIFNSATAGYGPTVGISVNGAAPGAGDAVIADFAGGTAVVGTRTSSTRLPLKAAVAPGAVITQQVKSNVSASLNLSQVWIAVRCVQIHP